MVIIYKMATFTYLIAKRIIKIPYVGLCNIVAGTNLVKELIQQAANPTAIAAEINLILENEAYQDSIRAGLLAVNEKLGEKGASQRAAKVLVAMVTEPS